MLRAHNICLEPEISGYYQQTVNKTIISVVLPRHVPLSDNTRLIGTGKTLLLTTHNIYTCNFDHSKIQHNLFVALTCYISKIFIKRKCWRKSFSNAHYRCYWSTSLLTFYLKCFWCESCEFSFEKRSCFCKSELLITI